MDLMTEFMDAVKPKESAQRQHVYNATVSRIEDGVVYVYLTGAETDTPTALSASEVKRGDAVMVEWRNNRLYIAGNTSNPAVGASRVAAVEQDARRAQTAAASAVESAATASEAAAQAVSDAATAQSAAETAQNSLKSVVSGATTVEKAVSVMQTALEAVVDYDPSTDTTKEYFWHDANGAHVLGTSGDYRADIKSTGMDIVDTATENSVATFGTETSIKTTDGTELAHFGYDLGQAVSGTAIAPYYTLGKRMSNSTVGNYSMAEGFNTTASGATSHAEGGTTSASGSASHAEGQGSIARGNYSHAEGYQTEARGDYTHAEGYDTETTMDYAHAQNKGTIASAECQTAIGSYNATDSYALFIVGNGTADNARSNALTVDRSGNVEAAGDIEDGSGNVLSAKANTSSIPTKLTDLTVDILTNSKSNVSIPKTTYTNLGQVTLPANGKYLVIGEGGCGAASSGTYFSLSTYTVSGTPTVAWSGTQQAPTNGGGQCSIMAYYATGSASAVIGLRGYLYGNGSTSGGWGQIVAVRIA